MSYLDPVFIIKTLGTLGVGGVIFAESGLFFGFFLPGDSLLFTAGLLASKGFLHVIPLLLICFAGAVIGDNIGYAFGKKIGPNLFKKEESFFFKKSHIEKTQRFFELNGSKSIILARFIPVVRTFIPILAGVGKMKYQKFFLYNVVGGFIWTFGLILTGYFLGKSMPDIEKYLSLIILLIIGVSLLPVVIEFLKARKQSK